MGNDARNLMWAHLSRCASFDPKDLVSYQVQDDWFVMAISDANQQYGIWRIDSFSGRLYAHDQLAEEWERFVESSCDPAARAILVLPTATPRPFLPTPILRTSSEAINTIWAYLVKCYPNLRATDLEAALDPAPGEYLVKDRGNATLYGVWRVDRVYGKITPDNDRAKVRDLVVKTGSC